ncbi:MAG: TonB-dependent receptor [Bacteroidales bacterium]|jgi:TonB-linked SusC/RagA family outer membrane protein|nr:TonB-dependent receptor [Bacteroidales bacterium]
MKQQLKRALTALLMSVICFFSFAQKTVTGSVKDTNGEPMIGVSVLVVGTNNGTVTDLDGNYTISGVSENGALKFSYIGYAEQLISVAGENSINVVMKDDNELLDEVVVIGYGVVRKRDLTGAVSSLKSAEIQKVAVSNAMQAMQAKVPGLDIQQSSGQAGSGLNITLRGTRSINASNSPLILVDGVEYGSTIDLNPSDIESMEVLKDASSTAIYGTRGANGVIMITTKKGKAGATKVNLNSYLSFNTPTNIAKMMFGDREVQRLVDMTNYRKDALSGDWGGSKLTADDVLGTAPNFGLPYSEKEIYDSKKYTNWTDLLLQTGLTQNYELSVSGGNEKTNFNISLGTMREEGLLKDDKLDRYNGKVAVEHQANNWLKIGADMFYTHKNHDKRSGNVFTRALYMSSVSRPYDDDGNIILKPSPYYEAHANPLLDDVEGAYQNNRGSDRIFSTAYLQINPLRGLVFKSLFNVDYDNYTEGLYEDFQSVNQLQAAKGSYISWNERNNMAYTWDNTLNYNTDFNGSKHNVTALLGSSTKQNVITGHSVDGNTPAEHYYTSAYYDLSLITTPVNRSSYTKTNMQSFFGRMNYSFDSRYIFTFSLRSDGSSVLAKGKKWGYFPSAALAWRISDEQFMQSTRTWLDDMKLRAAWGKTGNAAINAYQTLAVVNAENQLYQEFGSGQVVGRIPTEVGNEELTWEKTSSFDFGLDFSLLNSRLYGNIDYYFTETHDLLYAQSLPPSSVYASVLSNVGKTKGHGLEVMLGLVPVKTQNFLWDSNLSFSTSHDEIVELSNGLDKNISGRSGQIVGEPVNIFYYYESDGCWGIGEYDKYKAEWEARHPGETLQFNGITGDLKIIDRNDDGVLDDNDKKVYERSPKAIFGWNNNISYKNFALSFLLYARVGGYIQHDYNAQFRYDNANWADLDYWTPDNQGARFPTPGLTAANSYASAVLYEKASYLKLKDISLSYNLPKQLIEKIGLNKLRAYCSLKNYFTWSHIDNYDPERGGSIAFPLAKQAIIGLNVEF